MTDQIETIAGSVVQHGYHNHRIYVMHLDIRQTDLLIPTLDRLAQDKGYSKIFAKIPATQWHLFETAGYLKEAMIPGFFKGNTDGLFIAKFLSADRGKTTEKEWENPQETDRISRPHRKNTNLTIKMCGQEEAKMLADLYRRVFKTYAFPIDKADYLEQMMREDTFYFAVFQQKRLAAAAAIEIDYKNGNCEMTDFAASPKFRGKGLAGYLLQRLDKTAVDRGLKTAYTIARSDSAAMNAVFYQSGYGYAGRLVNNTQIAGGIRNMNIWYKRL